MTLTVFNNPNAQASFTSMMTSNILPRYKAMSDLPDAIKAVIARTASSKQSFDELVERTARIIRTSDLPILECIERGIACLQRDQRETIGDTLSVYFAQQVLEQDLPLTLDQKQKRLDQVKAAHPSYHAAPIQQPISFNKPEELEALITAYYKGRLPTTLTKMLETDLPKTLSYQIIAQGIPHDFIIQYEFNKCTTTYEELGLAETLEAKYGPHILTKQYAALEFMEQNADADDVMSAQGIEYFQKQYGDTRATQLAMMLAEFKETPHQVQHSGRELQFVNQEFIALWDKWDADKKSGAAHICITESVNELLRLPINILLFQDSLVDFKCLGNDLVYIPGWFGELSKLDSFNPHRNSDNERQILFQFCYDFSDSQV